MKNKKKREWIANVPVKGHMIYHRSTNYLTTSYKLRNVLKLFSCIRIYSSYSNFFLSKKDFHVEFDVLAVVPSD